MKIKLGSVFRRLWLLLWKNLILRKRQYIVTALEIILPTLFAIFMAFLRAQIPSISSDGENGGSRLYPVQPEEYLIQNIRYGIYPPAIFAFSPNTTVVRKLIDEMGTRIFLNASEITWLGFDNERELEAYASQIGLQGNSYEFKGALVFQGLDSDDPQYYRNRLNHKISYKIRIVDRFYDTKEIMPWSITGDSWNYNENNYNFAGFSGVQVVVDKILMEMMTGKVPSHSLSNQAFPSPPSKSADFDQIYYILLPQFMVLGFIFIIPSIVRGIVSEKETGIKELMKMTGLPNWMHWVGWMMNSLVVLIISITLVLVLFYIPFSADSGAVLKNSDPTLWWIVFLIYIIWATCYCFLVSSLFERPTLATTAGIVVWLVTYYGVALPLEQGYVNMSLGIKLLVCLSPNMALHYALKVMCAFEARGIGAKWTNIADPVNSIDSLTLGYVLIMFFVDIVLYTTLAMYFEKIIPSKYGVRKPFYYIFLPSEWGFGNKQKSSEDIADLRRFAAQAKRSDKFEKVPEGFKVGVEVLKLRKEFGNKKVAVDDLSVNVYEGQIFCLLGHNGAGKTTAMSILTGLFGPSSGTALINGKDIRTEMDDIRQNLGLCPQHNLLFSKLTVAEHLKFFGMVKGLTGSEAEKEIPVLIEKLQLAEKANKLASSLSGGQKRKLNLGCAIIGGSKVLFLDECSSGLDPEARRAIWDLLLEIRGQRTIILTTHFLEEADVLGDRIAIMASGQVKCCGSPMFLKKYYGAGYTLSLTLTPGGDPHSVLETIKSHVPTAFIKSHSEGHLSELAITLPSENNNTSNFPTMFTELLAKKQDLKVEDIGISLTTMDEVFIKVEEISNAEANGSTEKSGKRNGLVTRAEKSSGLRLLIQQFWGLLLKKVFYSLKRWKLSLFQMIVPVALLIAAILISNTSYNRSDRTPPLTMTLSSYKDPRTLYAMGSEEGELGPIFDKVVGSSATRLPQGTKVESELLNIGMKEPERYRERYIVAADFKTPSITAMYSTVPAHACPLAMNLVTNTMLRQMGPDNNNFYIEVTNHPMSSSRYTIYDAANQNSTLTEIVPYVVGVLLSVGLALLTASFIIMPIEERTCQAKQLQLMSGVNPLLYWGSAFLWDYFVMIICICVMTACFPIFEKYSSFTNNYGAGVAFLIMAVYAIGAISFSYLLSLVAQTVAGGFSLVTIIHIVTGTALGLATYVLDSSSSWRSKGKILAWIGRLFPTFGMAKSSMIYAKLASGNAGCNSLTEEVLETLCTPDLDIPNRREMQTCCANCVELGAKCFTPKPYLVWTDEIISYGGEYNNIRMIDHTPGIAQELLYMFLISVIYTTILILIELGYMKKFLNTLLKQKDMTFKNESNDNDVQKETDRVQDLIQTGRTSEDAVVVDNLSKSFGTFSAVSKLSFGVHHGECFGLLGVNGAGKTTSFRMLTGDEIISTGNAFLNLHSLQSDRKRFLSKIGYCPQFDSLINVLSGKQMLELFGRLRGIEGSTVSQEADKWLSLTGLSESGRVQCGNYSGGMKRRLSAAMAMIGDPPVVFLDEPTSGVDPVSRRQFWNIISSVRDSGQAIILTSHSMEECEVLCARLGIMVNGELQCLGGVQHLKNKFAQGYSLTIRLKPEALISHENTAALANEVIRQFYPCSLKDQHQNTMQFHIESTSMQWDELFKTMESIKTAYAAFIDEYSVSQTTLEEVFLSFARKQYNNERQVKTSVFRKLLAPFGC